MISEKLFLVEDNDDVREVFAMILSAHGYDVVECPNGSSAVQQARQIRPTVGIVDVGLPDIDGYQVAAEIRKIERELALPPSILVALTGHGGAPSRRQAYEAGFDLHFAKPVELKTICAEIKNLQNAAQFNNQRKAA